MTTRLVKRGVWLWRTRWSQSCISSNCPGMGGVSIQTPFAKLQWRNKWEAISLACWHTGHKRLTWTLRSWIFTAVGRTPAKTRHKKLTTLGGICKCQIWDIGQNLGMPRNSQEAIPTFDGVGTTPLQTPVPWVLHMSWHWEECWGWAHCRMHWKESW